MKITIEAVPVETLDDIQKTLGELIEPIHGFLFRTTKGNYRKGIIKGISIALDVIELYKGGEKWTIK